MSNLHNRVKQLESNHPAVTLPLWAELWDGFAVLRYEDGRRVRVSTDEIPRVKTYEKFSPDSWNMTHEQLFQTTNQP
jgi:hypothetical protein